MAREANGYWGTVPDFGKHLYIGITITVPTVLCAVNALWVLPGLIAVQAPKEPFKLTKSSPWVLIWPVDWKFTVGFRGSRRSHRSWSCRDCTSGSSRVSDFWCFNMFQHVSTCFNSDAPDSPDRWLMMPHDAWWAISVGSVELVESVESRRACVFREMGQWWKYEVRNMK